MRNFFQELFGNSSLLLAFTKRTILEDNKGSYVGEFWNLLGPLIQFAIYFVVFGILFGGKYHGSLQNEKIEYALGVFTSLAIFRCFSDVLGSSPRTIIQNPNFIKKVVFPLALLPLIRVLKSFYHLSINLLIIAFAVLLVPVYPGWGMWKILYLLPALFIMLCGVSYFLSAFGVFFRDISKIVENANLIFLYASAVFFSSSLISAHQPLLWTILKWNPLLQFVEISRMNILWGRDGDVVSLVYLYVFSVVALSLGVIVFQRSRRSFSDFL